jgi:SpoIID/LytB domain protein
MKLRILFILIGLNLLFVSCVSVGKEKGKIEVEKVEVGDRVKYVEFREVFPEEPEIKVGIGKGRSIRLKTFGRCEISDGDRKKMEFSVESISLYALEVGKKSIKHWVILERFLDRDKAITYKMANPDLKILKLGVYPRYFVAIGPFDDFEKALRFKHPNKKSVFSILEKPSDGKIRVAELKATFRAPIQISCDSFGYKNNKYKGKMLVFTDEDSGLILVNSLKIEDYLKGVVPWEMSPSYPIEALKAQAIAARTHALEVAGIKWHLLKEPYDVTDDFTTQVYRGFTNYKVIDSVVESTRGLVMMNGDRFSIATFFTNCGGSLEGGEEWGDTLIKSKVDAFYDLKPSIEILKIKKDTSFACSPSEDLPRVIKNEAENFRWEKAISLSDITESLKKNFNVDIGKVKDIKILRRSESGRVKELEIIGTKGKYRVKGDWNIRKALGNLKSSFFVFKKKGDRIIFKGGGWGHGIGMCQVGAGVRALRGWKYEDILRFYYGNVELVRVYK